MIATTRCGLIGIVTCPLGVSTIRVVGTVAVGGPPTPQPASTASAPNPNPPPISLRRVSAATSADHSSAVQSTGRLPGRWSSAGIDLLPIAQVVGGATSWATLDLEVLRDVVEDQ